MTAELYLTYFTASAILLAIPGPTIMLVVSYALSEGRRSAWGTVPGVALGDFTAMTCSLLGLGAVLSASAALFMLLKYAGAAYLIYLGIKKWRSAQVLGDVAIGDNARSLRSMLGHAFAVTALNPKSIVFFIAFMPQFLSPARPMLPQMLILGSTFLVLAILNATLYALLAGTLRKTIRRPSIQKTVNRVSGSLLIGAGLMTAALRRSS